MMCIKGKKGDPVNIGRLERFLADWEGRNGVQIPEKAPPTGKKVAVIGAGPGGSDRGGGPGRRWATR